MKADMKPELSEVRVRLRHGIQGYVRARRRRQRLGAAAMTLALVATMGTFAIAAPSSRVGQLARDVDLLGLFDIDSKETGEPRANEARVLAEDGAGNRVIGVPTTNGSHCTIEQASGKSIGGVCAKAGEITEAGLRTMSFGTSRGRDVLSGVVADDVDEVFAVLMDGTRIGVPVTNSAFAWSGQVGSLERVERYRHGANGELVSAKVIALLRRTPQPPN
jgi:hypothetical protein